MASGPAWREASLPREHSPRLVNEGQPSASEAASRTESHLYTILSVLRGDSGIRRRAACAAARTSVEIVAGPVADDSQASLETRTSVAVETYQMTYLPNVTSGTTTSRQHRETERSEHRGNYEMCRRIRRLRKAFKSPARVPERGANRPNINTRLVCIAKIYDAAAPEDDPWLIKRGCT